MSRKTIPNPRKQDDPAQSKRFIDTAREREADETKEGAERGFAKVVKRPPSRPIPAPKGERGNQTADE
jgi:hypothetical protein